MILSQVMLHTHSFIILLYPKPNKHISVHLLQYTNSTNPNNFSSRIRPTPERRNPVPLWLPTFHAHCVIHHLFSEFHLQFICKKYDLLHKSPSRKVSLLLHLFPNESSLNILNLQELSTHYSTTRMPQILLTSPSTLPVAPPNCNIYPIFK